jgi:flagellar hook assembly protein FlgD
LRVLRDGLLSEGVHAEAWDGRDDQGRRVATGVYLYRLVTAEQSVAHKIVLTR